MRPPGGRSLKHTDIRTYGHKDGRRTDERTDTISYRGAYPHLKIDDRNKTRKKSTLLQQKSRGPTYDDDVYKTPMFTKQSH